MILLTAAQRLFLRTNCSQLIESTTLPLTYGSSVKAFCVSKVRHSSRPLHEYQVLQDLISGYPGASNRCVTTNSNSSHYMFPVGNFSWRPVVFTAPTSELSTTLMEQTIRDRYSATRSISDALIAGTQLDIFGMQKIVLVSTKAAPSYSELLSCLTQSEGC